MSDGATDPTAALQRLGLSKYEAEVFVALQRIDTGTASDVATVADVPRSQVYGAADDLEARGLIDVQHGSPKRYRAVSLAEAREQLRRDFEREHERAFEALEALERRFPEREERQEEIWTVTGSENVDARIEAFVADAEETVRLGTRPSLLTESVESTLIDVAETGSVIVVSADPDIQACFEGTSVETVVLPETYEREGSPNSRILVVDGRTVLLSVIGPGGEESAFWSEDTDFSGMLVQLLDGYFGQYVDL